MFWTLIGSLFSGIPGMIGEYFKRKQEIELANLETQRQIALATQQAVAQQAISADSRAVEGLKVTGMSFKYCVFWLMSSPFIACLVNQQWYAEMVFHNLQALPQWYMLLYSGIIAVIWGIPVPGTVMGNIWDGIKNANALRREYNLAKIDRKAYWDAFRVANKGVPVTQEMVNKQEAVFSELDKESSGN